jgi:hypothetical protein
MGRNNPAWEKQKVGERRVHHFHLVVETPQGKEGSNLKGVLPKSDSGKENSTQARGDLVRLFSHDGRTEERARVVQLRGQFGEANKGRKGVKSQHLTSNGRFGMRGHGPASESRI